MKRVISRNALKVFSVSANCVAWSYDPMRRVRRGWQQFVSASRTYFVIALIAVGFFPATAVCQNPFLHLYNQQSGGNYVISATPPSGSSSTVQWSVASGATGTIWGPQFAGQISLTVPAGETIYFEIWMATTTSVKGVYPAMMFSFTDSQGKNYSCSYTSSSITLTTALTKQVTSCVLSNPYDTSVTVYFQPGVNIPRAIKGAFTAEVGVQGTSLGQYDSYIEVLLPSPTIQSLTPTSGPAGASVTIGGQNFNPTQGNGYVTFNGLVAPISNWSNTSITATVPSGATTGPVVVVANGQGDTCFTNCTFTVTSPSISGISPTSGITGTPVTINGANFGSSQGTSTVTFNGVSAVPTSWSATSIVAPVPTGATSGSVVVAVNGVASNGYFFSVTNPSISNLSPTAGPIGTSVTISGSNFGSSQGSSTVTFNGTTASPTSWNNSAIVAPVPSGATTGPVVVTVGVASNGASFAVAPGITNISPSSATGGTSVTITGTTFGSGQGTSTVTFNGTSASPTSWSNTQIVTPIPTAATSGPVIVTVGGLASNSYTYAVVPSINSMIPTSGGAGTSVTLSGTSFGASQGASSVTFNGTSANPKTWSPTTITVPVPSNGTTGPVVVTVGGQASNGITFTFSSSGTISGLVSRASDGSPISGVVIQVTQAGAVLASGTSGSDGSYSVSSLAAGTYSVYASPSAGMGYSPSTQNGVLVSPAKSTTVNFSLTTPVISSVSPTSGMVGSTVVISGSGFGNTAGASTIAFNGVIATPTVWSAGSLTTSVPSGATTGPVVVSVGGVSSNSVTFTIGTGAATGAVTQMGSGTPISGALVELLQTNLVKASVTTLSDGTYSISNLNPGTYDFRFSNGGFGTTITAGQVVNSGGSTTVNASLSGPGTISGKVTKSDGTTAIQGATVTVLQGSTAAATATSDSNGNYSLASLSAGSYSVQAAALGYTTQIQGGVSVTAGSTATENFSLVGQSVISYAYDGLGRLVGVSDSQGGAATYAYDIVGNLLSISTNPTSQISIMGFVPTNGGAGTAVTISGTGFNATPSQNTVLFNGAAATITSASATQLVVSVPSSATTGTISVTSPVGTATSSSPFTISPSGGQPTISSFSPAIGAPGSALTVNGTNFDTTPARNSVKVNSSYAQTSSANGTSLTATVPTRGSSGHVAVTTAGGQAVTSGYFFSPPSSYSVSTVGSTGSVTTNGGTATVTLNTAGQIALVVFDAVAGQQVSSQLNSNISQGYWPVTLSILNPYGATLASNTPETGGNAFVGSTTLPLTGTYTALVVPAGSNTGSGTVTVYLFNDKTGTIAPCYTACNASSFSTQYPTQNVRFSFAALSGLRISAVLNSTYGQGYWPVALSILTPYGATLASNTPELGGNAFIDSAAVTTSGTYTLVIAPTGANQSGSGTVAVYLFNDVSGTITSGAQVPFATNIPGQNARFTFSGTAGQQVSAQLSSSYSQGYWPVTLAIINPDGSTLTSNSPEFGGNVAVGPNSLPSTGTYTVLIDPAGTNTGSGTVTLTLQ